MTPLGLQAAQQRIADIQRRFTRPGTTFAAGLAQAQAAAPMGPASAAPSQLGQASLNGVSVPARGMPVTPAGSGWATGLPSQAQPWIGAMESAAQQAGIDPRLLASLVQAESGFQADARSHAGAIGLGQLMPGTAQELGVDPADPVQNLQGAARYLRTQLDRFGSVELALAAYNAGPGRVAQAGGIPRITETQQYVARVVQTYDELRSR